MELIPIDKAELAGEKLAGYTIDHAEKATDAAVDHVTAHIDEVVGRLDAAAKDAIAGSKLAAVGVIDSFFQRLWQTRVTFEVSKRD
jgi:hypothetical protein